MPRSSISKPTSFRVDAVRLLLAQRGGADEVVLLPADDPVQIRFERASSSRRCRCRAGASPPRGAACRARRGRTGSTSAGRPDFEDRLPDAVGRLRRDEDLEAVLAGVAGARDRRADVRRPRRARTSSTSSPPRSTPVSGCSTLERLRVPARRAARSASSRRRRRRRRPA